MLTSPKAISDHLSMDISNINKTYFNGDPKKLRMGVALDRGTYLAQHNITDEELIFIVEFMTQHKEFIKNRI